MCLRVPNNDAKYIGTTGSCNANVCDTTLFQNVFVCMQASGSQNLYSSCRRARIQTQNKQTQTRAGADTDTIVLLYLQCVMYLDGLAVQPGGVGLVPGRDFNSRGMETCRGAIPACPGKSQQSIDKEARSRQVPSWKGGVPRRVGPLQKGSKRAR